MSEKIYDLIVVGAGPGGYTAAIRARQLGLNVCLVEKDKPGGVCLNWGCIPTKNMIHQAEIFLSRSELEEMGVVVDTDKFDFSTVVKKSRGAADRLVKGVEYLLKKNKVDVVKGTARFVTKNSVALEDGTIIDAKNIMIATGSRPLQVPGFETDEKQILSSTGILAQKKLPQSLIILGGGAIGCEFAFVMHAFGVKVHLVEMMEHILPTEDKETVAVLARSFKKKKISVMTGTRALSLHKSAGKVQVNLQLPGGDQKQIEAEQVLCVFGRTPNTDDLGLEQIGLKPEKGFIPVGDYGQTSVAGVFAIGDVVATPLLAHVASKEAENAVEYIAGHPSEARIDEDAVPSAIYCQPQLASFGLRESQAKGQNIPYGKVTFPYQAIGKAVATGKAEGLVKVLYDPDTEEILGGHIVGCSATELIHQLLLAKTNELIPEDIAKMIHAHPTLSEGIMEVMREVSGNAIHI